MDNEDVMPCNLLGTYRYFTETYHFQRSKSVNRLGKGRFRHMKWQDQCCKQANVRLMPAYGLQITERKRDTHTALKFSPPIFIKKFLPLPLSKLLALICVTSSRTVLPSLNLYPAFLIWHTLVPDNGGTCCLYSKLYGITSQKTKLTFLYITRLAQRRMAQITWWEGHYPPEPQVSTLGINFLPYLILFLW